MDNLKKPTSSLEKSSNNKIIDIISNLQLYKEIINKEDLQNIDIKKYNMFVKNIQIDKLKIEKSKKWDYRITKINYDRLRFDKKKELENSLVSAIEFEIVEWYDIKKISNFLNRELEIVKYYYNENSLNNNFLPTSQNQFVDYNRNIINLDDNFNIQSINNEIKKEIILPIWDIEKLGLILPIKVQTEIVPINMLTWPIKEFILENDVDAIEYKKNEIENDIVESGSGYNWWRERIKNIINNNELWEKEQISEIKQEYWTWGSTVSVLKELDWSQDYSPWLGIIYTMKNWQVFPFSWKQVYNIYKENFSINDMNLESRKDNNIKTETIKELTPNIDNKNSKVVSLLDSNFMQLWIFEDNWLITDLEKNEQNTIFEKDLWKDNNYNDILRKDLKKKALFWMIENNSMWKFILIKQPEYWILDSFNVNQLNSIREKINNNYILTATIVELRCLFSNYNLEDIDWGWWEFSKILNSSSREYIKWAFHIRLQKIINRINEYDNPIQSLEEFYSSYRVKEYDLLSMDLYTFKKVISWVSTLYNHDLMNIPKKEIKEVIKIINKFMRWVKHYIRDNNVDVKEIDLILAKDFLKNYLSAKT